jgi:hypothetical protein
LNIKDLLGVIKIVVIEEIVPWINFSKFNGKAPWIIFFKFNEIYLIFTKK